MQYSNILKSYVIYNVIYVQKWQCFTCTYNNVNFTYIHVLYMIYIKYIMMS